MIDTLQAAKDELEEFKNEGATCKCCGQYVKVYRRKLTGTMVAALIKLVRKYLAVQTYRHVSELDVSGSGGEFAQLKRWGLIEPKKNDNTSKRVSGLWKPTDKGIAFVRHGLHVPAYCLTYNGDTEGFSEEETTAIKALGEKFDYAELMGWLI